jgi:hypothetical protein
MAITVEAADSKGLLAAIYGAIDDGQVETWTYDEDGDFVHHTADQQWEGQAWLTPSLKPGVLTLNTVPPKTGISGEAYAVYHGRFIEMLLAHFDQDFSVATATALPTDQDRVE